MPKESDPVEQTGQLSPEVEPAGTTTCVSVASNGMQGNLHSDFQSVAGDRRYVALSFRASNLGPGDSNGNDDAYVHDRQTGETTRVLVASDGTQGNNDSFYEKSLNWIRPHYPENRQGRRR